MVAPAAPNLEVPARVPFATEAQAAHEANRGVVVRLDVGLDPVQPVSLKEPGQRYGEGLAHVALAGMRHADLITQVRRPKVPASDLAGFHGTEDDPVATPHDEPVLVVRIAICPQHPMKCPEVARRDTQTSMEPAAASIQGHVLGRRLAAAAAALREMAWWTSLGSGLRFRGRKARGECECVFAGNLALRVDCVETRVRAIPAMGVHGSGGRLPRRPPSRIRPVAGPSCRGSRPERSPRR